MLIIEFFKQLWANVRGVIYLGAKIRGKELRQREQDTQYYFRKQSKKEMAKFQVNERLWLKKAWKVISKNLPKKYRNKDIYIYHNYFAGVLSPVYLNETPEKMRLRYWDEGVGPYFKMYKGTLDLIAEEVGKEKVNVRKIKLLIDSLPDLDARAEKVLEVQKSIHLKLHKKQQQLNEDRKKEVVVFNSTCNNWRQEHYRCSCFFFCYCQKY